MRLNLGEQQSLFEESDQMAGLDIVAVLADSALQVGFVEHGERCMVEPHLIQVFVHDEVDLVALQNYAHLSIFSTGLLAATL